MHQYCALLTTIERKNFTPSPGPHSVIYLPSQDMLVNQAKYCILSTAEKVLFHWKTEIGILSNAAAYKVKNHPGVK